MVKVSQEEIAAVITGDWAPRNADVSFPRKDAGTALRWCRVQSPTHCLVSFIRTMGKDMERKCNMAFGFRID